MNQHSRTTHIIPIIPIIPIIDVIWLGLLAIYILAGAASAPLHGDESTYLFTARDFYALAGGRLDAVICHEAPTDDELQRLRVIDAPLGKYTIALGPWLAGFEAEALNQWWRWSEDWEANTALGAIPAPDLLTAGRFFPALMGAAGVVGLFAIGMMLAGRPTAYLASALLALHPAYLLHVRRAMTEGALIGLSLLAVALALAYIGRLHREAAIQHKYKWAWQAGIGALLGLTFAAKHSGAITAAFVGLAVLLFTWQAAHIGQGRLRAIVRAAAIIALSALVIVALVSPCYWGDPVRWVGETLAARADLNARQLADRGGPAPLSTRALWFAVRSLDPTPDYAEFGIWETWIAEEIAAYEASPLRGLGLPPIVGGPLFLVGIILLIQRYRRNQPDVTAGYALLWMVSTAALLVLLMPLSWQRYYILIWPAVALLQGYTLARIAARLRSM